LALSAGLILTISFIVKSTGSTQTSNADWHTVGHHGEPSTSHRKKNTADWHIPPPPSITSAETTRAAKRSAQTPPQQPAAPCRRRRRPISLLPRRWPAGKTQIKPPVPNPPRSHRSHPALVRSTRRTRGRVGGGGGRWCGCARREKVRRGERRRPSKQLETGRGSAHQAGRLAVTKQRGSRLFFFNRCGRRAAEE
jgi:hypothetical protein